MIDSTKNNTGEKCVLSKSIMHNEADCPKCGGEGLEKLHNGSNECHQSIYCEEKCECKNVNNPKI